MKGILILFGLGLIVYYYGQSLADDNISLNNELLSNEVNIELSSNEDFNDNPMIDENNQSFEAQQQPPIDFNNENDETQNILNLNDDSNEQLDHSAEVTDTDNNNVDHDDVHDEDDNDDNNDLDDNTDDDDDHQENDNLETIEVSSGEQHVEIPIPNECVNGNYLPSTKNCSIFLACDHGSLKEVNCPPHMWFDPNYRGDTLCNYPEVVCAADNNICDCAEQYPPLPPDPLIEPTVTCLADNRFHMTPSNVSCGRYFICYNANVFRLECRAGFHFNPKTDMCDYPELVNCKIPDPDCPIEGISFLSHDQRKDAFYFCIHGFKTMQTCPFYHVWDSTTNSCKRRDEI